MRTYVKSKFNSLSCFGGAGENIRSTASRVIRALMKNCTMRNIGLPGMWVKILNTNQSRFWSPTTSLTWDLDSVIDCFSDRRVCHNIHLEIIISIIIICFPLSNMFSTLLSTDSTLKKYTHTLLYLKFDWMKHNEKAEKKLIRPSLRLCSHCTLDSPELFNLTIQTTSKTLL